MPSSTSKKIRLDSQVSSTSEFSNNTQVTVLPNDSDDSQGEYTDPNTVHLVSPTRSDGPFSDMYQGMQSNVNRPGYPPRTRQISWSVDFDREEEEDRENVMPQPALIHRYDNRTAPRTRRNTDSIIFEAEHERHMRDVINIPHSQTVVDFHQNHHQRLTDALVQAHDERLQYGDTRRRPSMQGRTQSQSSLRSHDHIYTSLDGPARPANTVVAIERENYLHPVTSLAPQFNQRTASNVTDGLEVPDNFSQASSRYVRVETVAKNKANHKKSCRKNCIRKGLYVLVAVNIVLNVSSFVYNWLQKNGCDNGVANSLCIKCNKSNVDQKDFTAYGIHVNEEGNCCLPELDVFISGVKKMVRQTLEIPMIKVKSYDINKNNTLKWRRNFEYKKHGNFAVDDHTVIKIPRKGYYYVYTHVTCEFDLTEYNQEEIFHEILITNPGEKSTALTSPKEIASPSNTSLLKHSSHLVAIQYLDEGALVSVRVSYRDAIHIHDSPSILGMFFISEI